MYQINSVVAVLAALVFALPNGADAGARWDWFGSTFDTVALGSSLSDAGASGGSWLRTTSSGAVGTVDSEDGHFFLSVDTEMTENLTFTADAASDAPESECQTLVYFPEVTNESDDPWEPPEVEDGIRAAILIGVSAADGSSPAFYGWGRTSAAASGAWIELAANGQSAKFETWFNIRTRFFVQDGVLYVEYGIETPTGLALLRDASGRSAFVSGAGTGTSWNQVLLRGSGRLDYLGASRPRTKVSLTVR